MRISENNVLTFSRRQKARLLFSTSMIALALIAQPAFAQTTPAVVASAAPAKDNGIEVVVVTAQKREESLQSVPISITAFGNRRLEQLGVDSFADYARLIPSLSYVSAGPGTAKVYFRGVASGGDGNHSGSQPSVGTYLDEQPITTNQGALDLHIYDIARVEALAGPQGTLYGASAQAGVVRIITNKPQIGRDVGAFGASASTTADGSPSYGAEGFVNIPVADNAAVRLVGWYQHDGGYIDNIPSRRTYPVSKVTIDNGNLAGRDYNFGNTYGARAALRFNINENWSVTPTIMGQINSSEGIFGYDPKAGDLNVRHYLPETYDDAWAQAALLIEGKVGDFDLTYSGSYLKRQLDVKADYTDYSFFYDPVSGASFFDSTGKFVDPSQSTTGDDTFTKNSHELRIASDQAKRFRFVAGVFYQLQDHHIGQYYKIAALQPSSWVIDYPTAIWVTNQQRTDEDKAIFGEATFDFTSALTGTVGGRFYEYDNSLAGYVGYKSAGTRCIPGGKEVARSPVINGVRCSNLDKETSGDGFLPKVNLTYKIGEIGLVYATYSEGFRPGGVNRRGGLPAYRPDTLVNYELGWKTTWLDGRLRLNGAVFHELWQEMQLGFVGLNGLTTISNVGNATINGIEADVTWANGEGFTLSASGTFVDATLDGNYCKLDTGNAQCSGVGDSIQAPAGTRLPVSPDFKASGIARYRWDMGEFDMHVQSSLTYRGALESRLTTAERAVFGTTKAYTSIDFSVGGERGNYSFEFFGNNITNSRGIVSSNTQCATAVCGGNRYNLPGGGIVYRVPITPRQLGVRLNRKF
jgi:iron complex outermembrane recepter protein